MPALQLSIMANLVSSILLSPPPMTLKQIADLTGNVWVMLMQWEGQVQLRRMGCSLQGQWHERRVFQAEEIVWGGARMM